MKDKHDLRRARFALGKADFADFVEITAEPKRLTENGGLLRFFRLAATGEDQRERERERPRAKGIHSVIWVQRHAAQ